MRKISVPVPMELEDWMFKAMKEEWSIRVKAPNPKSYAFQAMGAVLRDAALTAFRKGVYPSEGLTSIRTEKALEEAFLLHRKGVNPKSQVWCGSGPADVVDDVGVYELKLRPTLNDLNSAINQVLRYQEAYTPSLQAYVVSDVFPVSLSELRGLSDKRGVSFLTFDGFQVVSSVLTKEAEKAVLAWADDVLFSLITETNPGPWPPTENSWLGEKAPIHLSPLVLERLRGVPKAEWPDYLRKALELGLRHMEGADLGVRDSK